MPEPTTTTNMETTKIHSRRAGNDGRSPLAWFTTTHHIETLTLITSAVVRPTLTFVSDADAGTTPTLYVPYPSSGCSTPGNGGGEGNGGPCRCSETTNLSAVGLIQLANHHVRCFSCVHEKRVRMHMMNQLRLMTTHR